MTSGTAEMAGRSVPLLLKKISRDFSSSRSTPCLIFKRNQTTYKKTNHGPEFGLFFDIDGVIVRGRKVLPGAKEAFQLLTNKKSNFWVPTIFVTNAGNCLRQKKANQLSHWLDLEIEAEKVIMSHSPLKCFRQFLDKHVLVSGQGPVKDIAKNLGFTKVTTIDTLREAFPTLDMVDHKRRKSAPCAFEQYFPRIEAVLLFGEPVRWETNLQLIIDVLVTNGKPCEAPTEIVYPHIPVLACNMDLMWMAEAPMPSLAAYAVQAYGHTPLLANQLQVAHKYCSNNNITFAHGCFLHCLESLYQKVTGYELKYTALVGKPSELTYHHSEHVLQEQASIMGIPKIKRMYCIGDNPDADIYGANLYNRYLQNKMEKIARRKQKFRQRSSYGDHDYMSTVDTVTESRTYSIEEADQHHLGVEECNSLLVCTGVYNQERDYTADDTNENEKLANLLNHVHRDFIMDQELKKPSIIVPNVYEAVQAIFQKEGILTNS